MNASRQFGAVVAMATTAAALCGCGGNGDGGTQSAQGGTPVPPLGGSPASVPLSITVAANVGREAFGTGSLYAAVPINADPCCKQVDFFVDGLLVGSTRDGSPNDPRGPTVMTYSIPWNTTALPDGPHKIVARVTDPAGSAQTPVLYANVRNNIAIPFMLQPGQIYPLPNSNAVGNGRIALNRATGEISGELTVSNMTATSVHIHHAEPLVSGPVALSLVQDGSSNRWVLPPGTKMADSTSGNFPALVAWFQGGVLYVDAHSATFPDGEIRSQLGPAETFFAFGSLNGSSVEPPVMTSAVGYAAIKARLSTDATVIVRLTDVIPTQVAIFDRSNVAGVSPITMLFLQSAGYWSGSINLTPTFGTPGFNSGSWYINVSTSAYPSGEIRGPVPLINIPAASRLSELQATIFTPKCATCHTGEGPILPGSLDLTAGHSYGALVEKPSTQQADFRLVQANRSEFSYLMHKVEGLYSIQGLRMPSGASALTDAEIAAIKSWIDNGAPNN